MTGAESQWIVVPNWERFQHYADREPVWIKVYMELRSDDEWRALSLSERGLLVCLWIEYAASRGRLRTSDMSARVAQKVPRRALESLRNQGFIDIVASKPLALTRSREKERSKKKKGDEDTVLANSPVFVAPKTENNGEVFVCPVGYCRIVKPSQELLDEHLENVHGGVVS